VVTFTDITQRKQAEVALVASEERWKFAIEGAGDGLWDWNIQSGKAFYSPRYKAMFGYAEADIGDTADEWSKRIHPDDAPGVMAALQPYMDTTVRLNHRSSRCKPCAAMDSEGKRLSPT
jgi:PAS domain-containing protein